MLLVKKKQKQFDEAKNFRFKRLYQQVVKFLTLN